MRNKLTSNDKWCTVTEEFTLVSNIINLKTVFCKVHLTPSKNVKSVKLKKKICKHAGLLQRLEEETRANSYIVKERLPKDIESRKKTVADLQRVVAEPAMGQGDLDELQNKVRNHSVSFHSQVNWIYL